MTSLESYAAYRRQWEGAGQGLLTAAPTHMDIELTTACNLKCAYCPQTQKHSADNIDYDNAIAWLHAAKEAGVLSVKLNWRGESTLHPRFNNIFYFAALLKFEDLMLNTNGMYPPEVRPFIHKADTLIISLDSLDGEILQQLRSGSDKDIIVANLHAAVAARESYGWPQRIKINFTECTENRIETVAMQTFCDELKIELVQRKMFPRVQGLQVPHLRKPCGFPFQRLTVGWDGKVYPCCVPWWDESLCVGDLRKETIAEIWHGEKMSAIRAAVAKAEYEHPVCVNCTSWASYGRSE